ncbi:hypothetical protein [Neisseria dentiae]|nr:hypothetical protein [Neisseria dentiae]QMT44237.1 hypothetical protein H3L92_06990 [Neisseria dentiae]STZ49910.1 putative phage associated protein [Neisseria dentiae]STZ83154.1 putative phage associated protein [Neisseria dentiae]
MIYLIKYWKYVAAVLLVVCVFVVWNSGKQKAYNRGYNAATAKISAELAKAAKKQAEKAYAASVSYQEAKDEREQKERVRNVEVQKIIERPVYRNVCLDDGGLQIINDSTNGH